jgi:hypothetical protein
VKEVAHKTLPHSGEEDMAKFSNKALDFCLGSLLGSSQLLLMNMSSTTGDHSELPGAKPLIILPASVLSDLTATTAYA